MAIGLDEATLINAVLNLVTAGAVAFASWQLRQIRKGLRKVVEEQKLEFQAGQRRDERDADQRN